MNQQKHFFKSSKYPWFIAFIGIVFSIFIAYETAKWIEHSEYVRLDAESKQITLLIRKRLDSNVQLLNSAFAFLRSSEFVSRDDWATFVLAHRLEEKFTGIRGIGFAPYVPVSKKLEHENTMRTEGFENHTIFPTSLKDAFPVTYIEPFTTLNRKAFGYDMASEPSRKTAIYRALESGEPTLSSIIELVQTKNNEDKKAFIIYAPLYQNEAFLQTQNERMKAIKGVIYSAMNANELFSGILNQMNFSLDVEIYDGDTPKIDTKLYDSNPELINTRLNHYKTINHYGRVWTLRFKGNEVLDMKWNIYLPWIELIVGITLSLLVCGWLLALVRTREEAYRIAEEKTKKLAQSMRQVESYVEIVDANVITSSTNKKGIITEASEAFCKISGYSKKELIGKNHCIVRHPDMPKSLYLELWGTITKGQTWKGEIKNRAKDGSAYWVDATITPCYNDENIIIGYTAIRQDITDKKRIEELSITDRLTGLYNRLKLDTLFAQYLSVSVRHGTPLSIILLDIDKFKLVNDIFGHQVGDSVLQEIAKLMQEHIRNEDAVGRWGGEEFLILLPSSNAIAALQLAEKLRALTEAHSFSVIGKKTASFGVATYHKGDDEKSIVARADEALYRAKENGRNRVEGEEYSPTVPS